MEGGKTGKKLRKFVQKIFFSSNEVRVSRIGGRGGGWRPPEGGQQNGDKVPLLPVLIF